MLDRPRPGPLRSRHARALAGGYRDGYRDTGRSPTAAGTGKPVLTCEDVERARRDSNPKPSDPYPVDATSAVAARPEPSELRRIVAGQTHNRRVQSVHVSAGHGVTQS